MLINRRFFIGPCFDFRKSATISLALLKAVSPEVIGAATTPSKAIMPPNLPRVRDLVYKISGIALVGCHHIIQFPYTTVKTHSYCCPDHLPLYLRYHRPVKHPSSKGFILNTPGHQWRLSRMKSRWLQTIVMNIIKGKQEFSASA